jgi:hypothetical protein
MKYATLLIAALVLSGCARWSDRFHGSWLDEVGKPARPVQAMPEVDAAALTAEAIKLRGDAEAIRAKLAGEKDRVRRFAYMRELQAMDDRLHSIERVLQEAGRAVPAAGLRAVPAEAPVRAG